MPNPHPTPPALEKASTPEFADRDSGKWCSELKLHGKGEDYNWGFRIYRTVYMYTPESDEDFAKGMRILSANLRYACFEDAIPESVETPLNDLPNQQIWQRFKTEIIEDRTLFDGAPPAAIQKHFHDWIEQQGFFLTNTEPSNPSLRRAGSSTYRFCIIIDAETLRNLLRFPLRPTSDDDFEDHIGVKVIDVECHAGSLEYPPPFDEGWLWASPRELPNLWFDCPLLAADEFRNDDNPGWPLVYV